MYSVACGKLSQIWSLKAKLGSGGGLERAQEVSEASIMSTGLLSLEDHANDPQFSVNSATSYLHGLNPVDRLPL